MKINLKRTLALGTAVAALGTFSAFAADTGIAELQKTIRVTSTAAAEAVPAKAVSVSFMGEGADAGFDALEITFVENEDGTLRAEAYDKDGNKIDLGEIDVQMAVPADAEEITHFTMGLEVETENGPVTVLRTEDAGIVTYTAFDADGEEFDPASLGLDLEELFADAETDGFFWAGNQSFTVCREGEDGYVYGMHIAEDGTREYFVMDAEGNELDADALGLDLAAAFANMDMEMADGAERMFVTVTAAPAEGQD